MSRFAYKATNADGAVLTGVIDGVDKNSALMSLTKQGLKPVTIQLDTGAAKKKSGLFKAKVKTQDLVIFTRQLSTMVSAGVPLLRAITTLQAQTENPTFKAVLGDVVKDIQAGAPLGDAFAKHPEVFSDIYINMVRAGEAAGIMDDILKRMALQEEKNAKMKKKIKGAMTYPMVILSLTVVAFFGLMIFVIPMIGNTIKDLGGDDAKLPPVTEAMLSASAFMVNQWYIVLAALALGIFALKKYLASPSGTYNFHRFVLKAPIIKMIITKVAVARFSRTFASLMGAGVSVLESLKVTGRAIGNKVIEEELQEAAKQVTAGKQLSQALEGSKIFPAIIPQMLAVGEETGQIDTVLIKVADFYEEEVDTIIESMSSILEPVIMVVLGAGVGLIVYSVMAPITSLATNIG